MKKLLRPAIAAVAVLGVAAPFGVANSFGTSYTTSGYQYAVKYVCGCNLGGCLETQDDSLISYGDYRTVINLVNANDRDTMYHAVAVPTNGIPAAVVRGTIPNDSLEIFAGGKIDCPAIRTSLGGDTGESLIEGMVILRSCRRPIEVQTNYTAASANDQEGALVSTQVVTNPGSRVDDCEFGLQVF